MTQAIETYQQAIAALTQRGIDVDTRRRCINILHDVIDGLCQTPTCTPGETSLHDWLTEGDYSSATVTAADIAAEWDALTVDSE